MINVIEKISVQEDKVAELEECLELLDGQAVSIYTHRKHFMDMSNEDEFVGFVDGDNVCIGNAEYTFKIPLICVYKIETTNLCGCIEISLLLEDSSRVILHN